MRVTRRQLRRIIRESYYAHDYAEEERQSEPPLGSFPHHWSQGQMDDWNQGHQDALDNKGYGSSTSDEYMDGYEAGLQELETHPVGGRGMRQR